MKQSQLSKFDPKNMRKILIDFPQQVREAAAIGKAFSAPKINTASVRNIIVSGLGGSAIGGDVLRAFAADTLRIPFAVNRNYTLPEYADKHTLVIAASYSGNTEETLSVYRDAVKRKAQIVCISSGGELSRLAKKNGHPLIVIPGGYPPRTALGYSFFPVLILLGKFKFIPSPLAQIDETVALLDKLSAVYSNHADAGNPALELADALKGKLPVVYSAADRFDVVNVRWRGQIAENAKVLAFGHVYPEMNHNELVGWSQRFHDGKTIAKQMQGMAVIYLRDKDDHKRIQHRMNLTTDIIAECAGELIEIHSQGRSLLARMFSLIYLGDWVSYYLAILNQVDPTPVAVIDYLKAQLDKI